MDCKPEKGLATLSHDVQGVTFRIHKTGTAHIVGESFATIREALVQSFMRAKDHLVATGSEPQAKRRKKNADTPTPALPFSPSRPSPLGQSQHTAHTGALGADHNDWDEEELVRPAAAAPAPMHYSGATIDPLLLGVGQQQLPAQPAGDDSDDDDDLVDV